MVEFQNMQMSCIWNEFLYGSQQRFENASSMYVAKFYQANLYSYQENRGSKLLA